METFKMYGPDDDLELDYTKSASLIVPPNKSAHLIFSFQATWENCVCVYRLGDMETKIEERGNYLRDSTPWESGKNESNEPITYIISGWYKKSHPNKDQPWRQSRGKLVLETSESEKVIGFEDTADEDFNDAVVHAKILTSN